MLIMFIAASFSVAHAADTGFTALAPIPGLTDTTPGSVIDSATLANFLNNLYKYLIGLAAALAVIEIIWGGLEYSTQDSVSKKSDGKARIYQAILGLVLILSPVLIFSIINPGILNLSINLPKLDTVSSNYTSPATTPSQTMESQLADCRSKKDGFITMSVVPSIKFVENGQCTEAAKRIMSLRDLTQCDPYTDGSQTVCLHN